jgi:hypothetical protein
MEENPVGRKPPPFPAPESGSKDKPAEKAPEVRA